MTTEREVATRSNTGADRLNAELVVRLHEPLKPDDLLELEMGHFDLVPKGEGRTHFRIVWRDIATGKTTIESFGPGTGNAREIAYVEMGLHHPASKNKGQAFKFGRPDTHLHLVIYGKDANGKDNFINYQHGGSINLVWTVVDGELYVARVRQQRTARSKPGNLEGWTWAAPRGNLDPGHSLMESSDIEISEELGAFNASKPVQLPGEPVSQDTAWFGHYFTNDGGKAVFKGIHAVAREVPPGLFEANPDEPGDLRFRMGQLKPRVEGETKNALPEYIDKSTFSPWRKVSRSEDLFSLMVTRLFDHLIETERLSLTFKPAKPAKKELEEPKP